MNFRRQLYFRLPTASVLAIKHTYFLFWGYKGAYTGQNRAFQLVQHITHKPVPFRDK